MDKLTQIRIDAQVNAIIQQRNEALNTIVTLVGELALLKEHIKELETPGGEDVPQ